MADQLLTCAVCNGLIDPAIHPHTTRTKNPTPLSQPIYAHMDCEDILVDALWEGLYNNRSIASAIAHAWAQCQDRPHTLAAIYRDPVTYGD